MDKHRAEKGNQDTQDEKLWGNNDNLVAISGAPTPSELLRPREKKRTESLIRVERLQGIRTDVSKKDRRPSIIDRKLSSRTNLDINRSDDQEAFTNRHTQFNKTNRTNFDPLTRCVASHRPAVSTLPLAPILTESKRDTSKQHRQTGNPKTEFVLVRDSRQIRLPSCSYAYLYFI